MFRKNETDQCYGHGSERDPPNYMQLRRLRQCGQNATWH